MSDRRFRGFGLSMAAGCFVMAAQAWAGLPEGLDALRKGDYATAAKELRPLAERGDSEAQYRIGLMYEFGKGYPQDKAQAIAWFSKAAMENHAAAPQELAVMYATGDGVAKDDVQAVTWFRKAADLGNATAQYNLGLMYAKGAGIKRDDAQAIAWWRKAAAQGEPNAQFKLGVAYENGEGVARNPQLAYTNYAIATRNGYKDAAQYRDDIAKQLTPAQARDALAAANAWTVGQPTPTNIVSAGSATPQSGGAAVPATSAGTATSATSALSGNAGHVDKCTATGSMSGDRFSATHCAASLYGDSHSVAIWFNEDPISAEEATDFATSAYADSKKGGKPRTLVTIMFCPGGGAATANAAAVKTIDLSTNSAKSPLAGVQWTVEAGKDFKVDKLSGDLKPGGVLVGHVIGTYGKTAFDLAFDVALPMKDAAAGMGCGK